MIYNWIFAILVIAFGVWYFTSFQNRSGNRKSEDPERGERMEQGASLPAKEPESRELAEQKETLPAKKEKYEESESR